MCETKEEAKQKALEIIQSCDNLDQIIVCRNYLELFLTQFSDVEEYNNLTSLCDDKEKNLNGDGKL